jgi:hypothetical protein
VEKKRTRKLYNIKISLENGQAVASKLALLLSQRHFKNVQTRSSETSASCDPWCQCHINFFFVPAPKYFYMFLPSIRLVNDLRLRQGGAILRGGGGGSVNKQSYDYSEGMGG